MEGSDAKVSLTSTNLTLWIAFISGYLSHTILKSRYYPTVHNITYIVSLPLILLTVLATTASPLHSSLLALGFLVSLTVNRLFLAPICSYRGPFLAKLTKLWSVSQSVNGKQYKTFQSLFDRYGEDWIRTGPNDLVCRAADAIKVIYGASEYLANLLSLKLLTQRPHETGGKKVRYYTLRHVISITLWPAPWYDAGNKFQGIGSVFQERTNSAHAKRR
jgi:hypothetical protein